MKFLVSLWVMLASLATVSVQQCAIEDLNAVDQIESVIFSDSMPNITINSTFYNCLQVSQAIGLYQTMSVSFLFMRSDLPNALQQIRFNLVCLNGQWVDGAQRTFSALQSNNTRLNCSRCLDQTVNEYHCTR